MKLLKFLSVWLVLAVLCTQAAVTIHGLKWDKTNGTTNSDVWIKWTGSNILPRIPHTAIWRYNPIQQTGYYSVAWHANVDAFFAANTYEYGTHPWPASDCTVDGSGHGATGTNSGGTAHCWELAGLGANDFLSTNGTTGTVTVKSRWYTQVRMCRVVPSGGHAGEVEHRFYPDFANNPSLFIQQYVASVDSASGGGQFLFGVSPWSASGANNDETLSGYLRGIQLYAAWLDPSTDMPTEAANQSSNTPLTSAGATSVWYMNQDPIPSDVTDKSGAGHSPAWGSAQRPAQWDSTYTTGFSGKAQLLGVGRP